MASIIPKNGRLIGNIIPDVTIEESTTDSIELTSHPVQQGAAITDHKYRKPVTLKMNIMQAGNDQADLATKYKSLVDLQNSTSLFDVTTPKRIYKNMQIKSLGVTTDKNTENILSISADMQEVIIVNVTVTNVPARAKQKTPAKTGATENAGAKSATTETNPKRTSALSTLFGGKK